MTNRQSSKIRNFLLLDVFKIQLTIYNNWLWCELLTLHVELLVFAKDSIGLIDVTKEMVKGYCFELDWIA